MTKKSVLKNKTKDEIIDVYFIVTENRKIKYHQKNQKLLENKSKKYSYFFCNNYVPQKL